MEIKIVYTKKISIYYVRTIRTKKLLRSILMLIVSINNTIEKHK